MNSDDIARSEPGPAGAHRQSTAEHRRGLRRHLSRLRSRFAGRPAQGHTRDTPGPWEELFRTLIDTCSDAILILDRDDTIRYASRAAADLFSAEPVTGRYLPTLLDDHDRSSAAQALRLARRGLRQSDSQDWRVRRPDGDLRWVTASWRDLQHEPAVGGMVVTLRDVTRQRSLESELNHETFHDRLTGLPNRRWFVHRVEQLATRSLNRTDQTTAVLIVDLDGFRTVNDTKGHHIGDRVLVEVSRRLTEAGRSRATVARIGGDEFAVLVEDAGGPDDVQALADRILTRVAEPFTLGTDQFTVTVSIGTATMDSHADVGDLLRRADLALHEAKRTGTRRVPYAPAIHAAAEQRLSIWADLEQAIAGSQMFLVYQPIVALRTGRTTGFEALLRWKHPTHGMVPPTQFIQAAEENGLIVPIGNWVLKHAVAAAAQWQAAGAPPTSVNVNVSPRQLRVPGFADRVLHELASTGLPAACLVLEITESMRLREDDQVRNDLTRLRGHGVQVAIDDFGTGYSSLSYLQNLPVDILKIDKSFIDKLLTSDREKALVDAIVNLARTLQLRVVAEGIERPEQADELRTMECDRGQGYHFARPLDDAAAHRRLIQERHPTRPADRISRLASRLAPTPLATMAA